MNSFTTRVHWGFTDPEDPPALYVEKGDRPPGAKTQISAPAQETVTAFVKANRDRALSTSLSLTAVNKTRKGKKVLKKKKTIEKRGVTKRYASASIQNARYIVLVLRDAVDGDVDAIVNPRSNRAVWKIGGRVIAAVGALTDWTQTRAIGSGEYPYCKEDELYVDLLCSAKANTTANKGAATAAVAKMEAFAVSLAKRALVSDSVPGSEKFWVGAVGFVECEPIRKGRMDEYINGNKTQCKRRVHEDSKFISKALPVCPVPISAKAAVRFWTGTSSKNVKRPGTECAKRAVWNPPRGVGHPYSKALKRRDNLSTLRD